jgi:3-oxoacyl-(acyl-carrier-protein) synthase
MFHMPPPPTVTLPADAALVFPPEIKKYKAVRLMSGPAKRALMAVWQAATTANLDLTTHSPTRAVIVSAGDYDPLPEELRAADGDLDPAALRANTHPLWLLKTLPNMTAAHLAILTKSGGPSHTVASRGQARQLARDLIISGEAGTVICADLPAVSATIFTR